MPLARLTCCESDYLGKYEERSRRRGSPRARRVVVRRALFEPCHAQIAERTSRGDERTRDEQARQPKAECALDVPGVGLDGAKGREACHQECHCQCGLDDSRHIQGGRMFATGPLISTPVIEKSMGARTTSRGEEHGQTGDRGSSS